MNEKKTKKFHYVEPDDYFPKGVLEELKKMDKKKKQDQKKTAKKGKNAK